MISHAMTVIFDCDGVIFDSNNIKSHAFIEVIQNECDEAIDAFIQYHEAHGGISRFEKFHWFFRDYLRRPDWENISRNASEHFGDVVRKKLLAAKFVPGVEAFLEKLHTSNVPCFVVSGGAHEEVNWLLSERGIKHYFKKILGSPKTKIENLSILQKENALNLPGIFIGDADSDLQAAKAFNLQFVFVGNYSLWKDGASICAKENATIINDLTAL